MNNLSWFLYAADVLPSVSETFLVLSSVVLGLLILFAVVNYILNHDGIGNTKEEQARSLSLVRFVSFKAAPLLFLFIFISLLVPTKDTIYLIAASEIGEVVVASDQGQETLNKVYAIINNKLDELMPKTD